MTTEWNPEIKMSDIQLFPAKNSKQGPISNLEIVRLPATTYVRQNGDKKVVTTSWNYTYVARNHF